MVRALIERYPAIIGQRKAEYACQTSKLFTGQEALDWGLIDQLVSFEGK